MTLEPTTVVPVASAALVPALVVLGLVRGAGRLPPADVGTLATRLAALGGVGFLLAAFSLPLSGLLVVPLVPLFVAYATFGALVRRSPEGWAIDRTLAGLALAVLAGVVVLVIRGTILHGVGYAGHVVRPPSLLLSSVALAVAALAYFPLGRAVGWRTDAKLPFAWLAVVLPVAAVLSAALRPYDLTDFLLPSVFALVATSLGVGMFRLGQSVAARERAATTGADGSSRPP